MATQTLPRIHCFKSGRHTAMSGATLSFSDSDLLASAAAYDPAVFRAPIVVGHPTLDAPAYGWIDTLSAEADGLYVAADVQAEFADMVREQRFPNRSASFFPPGHPRNPAPGVFYLKHVGFLGAVPPAVRGLKPVAFADDADCLTIEFADAPAWPVARLFRNLRDWLIGNHDLATADQVLPAYQIEELESAARQVDEPETDAPAPAFSAAPLNLGDAMSPEEKARLDALEADNTRLKAEADALKSQTAADFAAFADREAALTAKEAAARQAEIAEFADAKVKAGQVLPRDKAGLVSFMASLADAGDIEFADGDATIKKPADEWLRNFLSALPAQVDFAERGATEGEAAGTVAFAAPGGYEVDPAALDLHQRALAHQAAHKTDYLTAVKAVSAHV